MPTIAGIKLLVKDITMHSNALPPSILQGTKADKIWNVMKVDERDTAHETFNMRFDAMFGEDCRDSGGRLHHISRGKFGLGCSSDIFVLEVEGSEDGEDGDDGGESPEEGWVRMDDLLIDDEDEE
ncbi:hypothetical protein BGY98DRAFT_940506 [Russula aff. rugulosa BPL654]|nr:hypothetical protein BGY98DRAFT_940506 [Russula aff. rugulosa BPL654]